MSKENKYILVIGDLHMRESLGYADYLPGQRKKEEQEVLDFIVSESKDCKQIVIIGDALNSKNNTSEVIKRFVEFLKRFEEKQVYILSGNHDKKPDGRTAIDFLQKIDNPDWKVITTAVTGIVYGDMELMFCPYFYKEELGVTDPKAATSQIYERLKTTHAGKKILFVHHAITGSKTSSGATSDLFDEPVLDQKELEGKFDLVVGGHVHKPQVLSKKTFVTGSVYNNEVGETQKYLWKINEEDLSYEQIALPGRKIYKIENPSIADINLLPAGGIVKIMLTDAQFKLNGTEELKILLKKKFDAYLLVEQYPRERKKFHFEEGAFDFSVEKLLEIYAKERKVDINKLKQAFSLINQKHE